jgi:hypothetical protein
MPRPKMYKSRITKWKLDKNNKESEMLFILHKMTERAAVGKMSAFRVRGQNVDYQRVHTYFRRRGGVPDIVRIASHNPPHITCRTPSPIPVSITPPTELHNLERVFVCISAYYEGSFSSGIWIADDGDGFCVSISVLDTKHQAQAADFVLCCHQARHCFVSGSHVRGRRILSQACNLVHGMFKTQDSDSPRSIIEVINDLVHWGLKDIATSMLDYISAMAQAVLANHAPNHPLLMFWHLLSRNKLDLLNNFPSLYQRLLQCTHAQFRAHLGQFHRTTSDIYMDFIGGTYDGTSRTTEQLQRLYLDECRDALCDQHPVVLGAALHLATTLLHGEQYVEAQEIGLKVAASCCLEVKLGSGNIVALGVVAIAQRHLGKLESAESSMREAVRLAEQEWSKHDILVIELLTILQQWLREWERNIEADELDIDIERRTGRDDVDEELERISRA